MWCLLRKQNGIISTISYPIENILAGVEKETWKKRRRKKKTSPKGWICDKAQIKCDGILFPFLRTCKGRETRARVLNIHFCAKLLNILPFTSASYVTITISHTLTSARSPLVCLVKVFSFLYIFCSSSVLRSFWQRVEAARPGNWGICHVIPSECTVLTHRYTHRYRLSTVCEEGINIWWI